MQRNQGFDPRRLRTRPPLGWCRRLAIGLASCLCGMAVVLLCIAIASLLGQPTGLAQLSHEATRSLLGAGICGLGLGIWARRRCRAQQPQPGLSLARHLRKKRG
jgi:hypothetical protein